MAGACDWAAVRFVIRRSQLVALMWMEPTPDATVRIAHAVRREWLDLMDHDRE
ncbi:MAG: hypothetical protein U0798_08310 [Gemmataceae bacterium]